jgi:predicted acyltransferase
MALGPVLLLLALIEKIKSDLLKPFNVFGRVPLFYFILHFYLAHAVALALFMIKTGKSFSEIDFHFAKSFGGITPEGGYTLPWVYVAWITIVLVLYPICKWYDHYKTTHKHWWLSYL